MVNYGTIGKPSQRTSYSEDIDNATTNDSRSKNGNGKKPSGPRDKVSHPTLSEDPILDLLNCEDEDLRDELTEKWRDNKLKELNFVGVVAALLTGCLTSVGSWPNILTGGSSQPWQIRTCWFVGIVFGLASIFLAAVQTIRLHRISGHENAMHRIRLLIKGPRREKNGRIRPSRLRMYVWQLPVFFLGAAVITMVSGIWVLVWMATIDGVEGFGWSANTKSATVFTVFAGLTIIVFLIATISLHRKVHDEHDSDEYGQDLRDSSQSS